MEFGGTRGYSLHQNIRFAVEDNNVYLGDVTQSQRAVALLANSKNHKRGFAVNNEKRLW